MSERNKPLALPDLSFQDVQNIVDQQNTRFKKVETLANLYCYSPQIESSLREVLNLEPDQFVGMFCQSFSPLLDALPEDYDLEFTFSPGDEYTFPLPYLRFKALIASKDVHTLSKERFQKSSSHSDYINELIFDTSRLADTSAAGRFGMAFFQESILDESFVFLMSIYTSLNSHSNLFSLTEEEKNRVLPVPLRVSEGSAVSISDAIRLTQETLLQSLAKSKQSVGIVATTPPMSAKGTSMLERQGYIHFSDLQKVNPQLQHLTNTATFKKLNEDEYYGKLIVTP